MAHVLRALTLYEKKPVHKRGASLGALRNLILSYVAREDIGDEDTERVCSSHLFLCVGFVVKET